ncbi:MAG TPA: hypothetical protein VFL78_06940 [Rhodanobacteraceae bacterium]|nr:hypothetical protein [Rhodanobacteraceae bacterium]
MVRAVVIHADSDAAGIKAEDKWLSRHYPTYHKVRQALLMKNGHYYDKIEVVNSSEDHKEIYFDITEPYNSLMRIFQKSG